MYVPHEQKTTKKGEWSLKHAGTAHQVSRCRVGMGENGAGYVLESSSVLESISLGMMVYCGMTTDDPRCTSVALVSSSSNAAKQNILTITLLVYVNGIRYPAGKSSQKAELYKSN